MYLNRYITQYLIFQSKSPKSMCMIAEMGTYMKNTHLMAGTADNGGEDSPGGVITGETGFAHAGAIVNNQSGNVFISHGYRFELSPCDKWRQWELRKKCPSEILVSQLLYSGPQKWPLARKTSCGFADLFWLESIVASSFLDSVSIHVSKYCSCARKPRRQATCCMIVS